MSRPAFLEKKFVETEAGSICYFSDISFPSRPCVLFLHGLSSNHTTWLHNLNVVHAHGYNGIAPDIRGHGYSDKTVRKENYHWRRLAEDIVAILDRERVERCVIVGYCFGGAVAQQMLLDFPERVSGVILVSANYVNAWQYKHIGFLVPAGRAILNFFSQVCRLQRTRSFHYYEHGENGGYWESVLNGFRTMPLSVNLWLLALHGRIDYTDLLPTIRVPVYIVRASRDPFVSLEEARDMKKAIPDSKLIISRNTSHFIASESQDEMAEIILDFLHHHADRNL